MKTLSCILGREPFLKNTLFAELGSEGRIFCFKPSYEITFNHVLKLKRDEILATATALRFFVFFA